MLNRRSALCSLALVTASALGWMGCESQKQTELVAGISTQVQVPRDLKTVQVSVAVEGTVTFCKNYLVYDGKVQLPRSLGALPRSAAGTPVVISVTGFTAADADDPSTPGGQIAQSPGYGCAVPAAVGVPLEKGGGARVLRVSKQPYSPNEILFVPMPLKFSCFDVPCGNSISDKTCKAGRCVDSTTQVSSLSDYSDNLLYGGDATCFGLDECFNPAATVTPLTVDDATCKYAVPGAAGGPPLPMGVTAPSLSGVTLPADGLNVRVEFDSGLGTEILDLDKDEGFSVPDATKPQIFQLAPGLCDLVHGTVGSPHRITAISVSPVCRPKLPSQSICAADQLKQMGANPDGTVSNPQSGTCSSAALAPVPSGVEFVIDPTKSATDFLAAAGSLLAKKNDPAFANLKVGIHFMPSSTGASCPTTLSSSLPETALTPVSTLSLAASSYTFDPAATVQNQIVGLENAFGEIAGVTNLVNKSVIVIANKGFTASCADAQMSGAQKVPSDVINAHKDIPTTIVEIGSGAEENCFSSAAPAKALVSAINASGGQCYNASKDSTAAQTAIIHAFTSAATCTYLAPTSSPDPFSTSSELWFSDPTIPGNTTVIPHSSKTVSDCRSSSGGQGWTQDAKGNVVLCKASCDAYQLALTNATVVASAATPSTPKLPTVVPIFALSGGGCVAKSSSGTPTVTDAGTGTGGSDATASVDSGTPVQDNCHMPVVNFNLGSSCDAYETCPVSGQLELSCQQNGGSYTCTCSQASPDAGPDGGMVTKVTMAADPCGPLNNSTLPGELVNICGFTLK